jgi:hypothetical protein
VFDLLCCQVEYWPPQHCFHAAAHVVLSVVHMNSVNKCEMMTAGRDDDGRGKRSSRRNFIIYLLHDYRALVGG